MDDANPDTDTIDMDSTDGPKEAGLENEIDMEKPGFVGRDAARRRAEQGAGRLLACLVLSGDGPDAWGDEPVFRDGEPVSIVRSAAFGHRIGKSLALACLPAELATPGTELAVEIMGERRPATVAAGALYDQDNARAAA